MYKSPSGMTYYVIVCWAKRFRSMFISFSHSIAYSLPYLSIHLFIDRSLSDLPFLASHRNAMHCWLWFLVRTNCFKNTFCFSNSNIFVHRIAMEGCVLRSMLFFSHFIFSIDPFNVRCLARTAPRLFNPSLSCRPPAVSLFAKFIFFDHHWLESKSVFLIANAFHSNAAKTNRIYLMMSKSWIELRR